MQKIDGTTIKINRGDILSITLTLTSSAGTPYIFEQGDKIIFSVYKRGKMDEDAVLLKEKVVEQETQSVEITCTSQETKIGDLINMPVEYWYEIELNNEYTVIGYDDNGAKVFMLYPEGSKIV